MADDRETMDPQIEADLKLIREALGADDDNHAAAFAIQVLADHLREDRIVMTRADLDRAMMRYAAHAVSQFAGELVRPIDMGNGTVGFERTGEPVPDPPAPH